MEHGVAEDMPGDEQPQDKSLREKVADDVRLVEVENELLTNALGVPTTKAKIEEARDVANGLNRPALHDAAVTVLAELERGTLAEGTALSEDQRTALRLALDPPQAAPAAAEEAEPRTARQREADDEVAIRLHQALGFEISLSEVEGLADHAPDARAAEIADAVVQAADNSDLDTLDLSEESKAILREAHETGGEPTDESRPAGQNGNGDLTTEEYEAAEQVERIMRAREQMLAMPPDMRPISEATGGRIAYALEVLASAARPDIFETQEAQQDDLAARLSEFGIEAQWPEGKTFAEAAEQGEITFEGPGVGRGAD